MPYKIVKRGKEYILKSPTKEFKHKTLAKAKSQKKLLEEKDAKVIQTQKVSQKVTVIVNQPRRRRAGQAKKQTIPQQQPVIQMRPSFNPMELYYSQARPQPRQTLTADEGRLKLIEEDIKKLREPFIEQMKQNHLERLSALSRRDSELLPKVEEEEEEEEEEEPQREIVGVRRGIPRRLSIDSEFQGATIGQLLQGDYGITDSGRLRTEPTKRQLSAIERWKRQNP